MKNEKPVKLEKVKTTIQVFRKGASKWWSRKKVSLEALLKTYENIFEKCPI